jgi:hypothetical protein
VIDELNYLNPKMMRMTRAHPQQTPERVPSRAPQRVSAVRELILELKIKKTKNEKKKKVSTGTACDLN